MLVVADAELEQLRMQVARLRRMAFGRSSERLTREADQLELRLEEAEAEAAARMLPAVARARDQLEPTPSPDAYSHPRAGRNLADTVKLRQLAESDGDKEEVAYRIEPAHQRVLDLGLSGEKGGLLARTDDELLTVNLVNPGFARYNLSVRAERPHRRRAEPPHRHRSRWPQRSRACRR